jgi:uncharacterized SAM-binding protein YcdF (DUF218 family)
MLFLFKKYTSPLLLPLPAALFLLVAGICLLRRRRNSGWGQVFSFAGLALLVLLSLPPVARREALLLEGQFAPARATPQTRAQVKWVVVLSGGIGNVPTFPPNSELSRASLVRLVEGIRLLNEHPHARLLLTGGAPFNLGPSEASGMRDTALLLGVDPRRIVVEEESWDTEEQAAAVRPIVRDAPFLLVTSAVHMPRAMALFRKQGMEPIPAPTDFIVRGRARLSPLTFYPSADSLFVSTQVARELLGLWWSRLRGQA